MSHEQGASQLRRRRLSGRYNETVALDRVATVASSVFVIGPDSRRRTSVSGSQHQQKQPLGPQLNGMPLLSNQATTGRNSQFHNLTAEDREALGGIEYTSLRLLLKIIVGRSQCWCMCTVEHVADLEYLLKRITSACTSWASSALRRGSSTPGPSTRTSSPMLARVKSGGKSSWSSRLRPSAHTPPTGPFTRRRPWSTTWV